jgi:hypothetical protein
MQLLARRDELQSGHRSRQVRDATASPQPGLQRDVTGGEGYLQLPQVAKVRTLYVTGWAGAQFNYRP